ncbi:hypothetical protein [Vibrio phage vB_VmeM-Yong MS31]|nr:hypothetical protein [Vibrio phage vB_VmeM-Yong MS31]
MWTTTGLKILFVSDIHLLHRRVKTADISSRLLRKLFKLIKVHELDYLVIAGDLFDAAQLLPEADVGDAQLFISMLLTFCQENNVKLRVLEGTPSHDRKQSSQFVTLNNHMVADKRTDLRYVETIDIITEEDGSTWLYVPDEISDPDSVWEMVRERLAQEGLESVDFAVTHGMYKHHVKQGLDITAHDPDAYLSIVDRYVNNGHIHTKSIYKKRFITNGSWDRLKQGEEEQKGLFVIEVSPLGIEHDKVHFYENEEATYMVTLDVTQHTFERTMEVVEEHCHPEERRFIRLLISESLYSEGVMQYFSDKYPNIVWDKQVERDDVPRASVMESFAMSTNQVTMTKDNADELLAEEMRMQGISEEEIEVTLVYLDEILEAA